MIRNPLGRRKMQPQKPLLPNEEWWLFKSPSKGYCYFKVCLDAVEIYDTVTNDWYYWYQVMSDVAKVFGCGKLRTWTSRNPLAYVRLTRSKLNQALSGINGDTNEYIWCMEKEVM